MAVFMLNGMVTRTSAAVPTAEKLNIDYVEIQDSRGRSTSVHNVCAAPELGRMLSIGASGKFFFRDLGSTKRLLGVERTDGVQAFDLRDPTVAKLQEFMESTAMA